jgi:tetratricopeptide (TPR) repeat protein
VAAAALAALSTMAKETTAGFCAAVGLLELVRSDGAFPGRWKRAVVRALPYAAALALVFVLRGLALRHAVADVALFSTHEGADPQIGGGRPVFDNLLTQARVVVLYLQLIAFPVRLNVDHDVQLVVRALHPSAAQWVTVGIAVVFHFTVVGLALAAFRRGRRLLPLCVGWFWVFLAPSVVIPLNVVMNEHRLYLPGIAVSLLAGGALARASRRLGALQASPRVWLAVCAAPALLIPFMEVPQDVGGPAVLVTVGVIGVAAALARRLRRPTPFARGSTFACAPLLLLVPLCVHRGLEWQSDELLWTRAVQRSPRSARAHMHLGAAIRNRANRVGRLERLQLVRAALVEYERSERLHGSWVDLHLNIAEAHLALARDVGAREHYENARAAARRICEILGKDVARALMLEVQALTGLGRFEEAEEIVARLRRDDPADTPLYDLMLGAVLRKKGDAESARAAMERAIGLAEPERRLEALCTLGWWWFEDGVEAEDAAGRERAWREAETRLTRAKELADSPEGRALSRRYLPFLYIARFLTFAGEPGAREFYRGALQRGWNGRDEEQIWVRGGPTPGLPQQRLGTTGYREAVETIRQLRETE